MRMPVATQPLKSSERQAARRAGENGYRYKQQYGLIVPCKDEAQQRRRFARLARLGYEPKVVCV